MPACIAFVLVKWSHGFHQKQSWCTQVFSTTTVVAVGVMTFLNYIHFSEQVPTSDKLSERFFLLNTSLKTLVLTWDLQSDVDDVLPVLGGILCKGLHAG